MLQAQLGNPERLAKWLQVQLIGRGRIALENVSVPSTFLKWTVFFKRGKIKSTANEDIVASLGWLAYLAADEAAP